MLHHAYIVIMKKKNRSMLYKIAGIFILGLIVSWLAAESGFPSAIDKASWLGFFGSYIGSGMGAAATVIGIKMTAQLQQEKDKKDYEIQKQNLRNQVENQRREAVKPYFIIKKVDRKTFESSEDIGKKGCNLILLEYEKITSDNNYVLKIKNIGRGPALKVEMMINIKGKERFWHISEAIEEKDYEFIDIASGINVEDESVTAKNYAGERKAELRFQDLYGNCYTYELNMHEALATRDGNQYTLCVELDEWNMKKENIYL